MCIDRLSALKSQIPEIFHNQMPGLASEQRTGFSVLKGHGAELRAGGRHNLLRQTGVDLG